MINSINKPALGSYFILKKVKFDNYVGKNYKGDFFLDSGAFSAFTKNISIDIDKYIDYIKKYNSFLTLYTVLDVIGDWKETEKNQQYMESKGLEPLPTFHYKSPLSELKRLVDKYDYIALGGLVPIMGQRKILKNWLSACFSIIKLKSKIHGFGVNSFWCWKQFPFYSVDATSWLTPARYRRMTIFSKGATSVFRSLQKDRKKDSIVRLDLETKHYTELLKIQLDEYLKMEKFITRLWEVRGIIW